jgi:hypothetical protein
MNEDARLTCAPETGFPFSITRTAKFPSPPAVNIEGETLQETARDGGASAAWAGKTSTRHQRRRITVSPAFSGIFINLHSRNRL